MDTLPSHRLLVVDALANALLLVKSPAGNILAEQPLPSGFSLVDITLHPDGNEAYLALAGNGGKGLIATVSLPSLTITSQLPTPHPVQMAYVPNNKKFILTDPDGTLYCTQTSSPPQIWGKPDQATYCTGLTAVENRTYGVWETPGGGVLAVFDENGQENYKRFFGAVPTNLISDPYGHLLIPFTAGPLSGEGILVLSHHALDDFSTSIITQCHDYSATAPLYPKHAVVANGTTAYLANEEAGHLSIIDLPSRRPVGTIPLGQSVSRIGLLPGDKFAIASSNMFANLCLIDLVNRRLIAFTDERETLSPFAVLAV
ncbi:MAG: hypothetical protein H6Q75_880 [Firmicutes bacterium]|nr:hypothetical protein [Bacillota bacterium]